MRCLGMMTPEVPLPGNVCEVLGHHADRGVVCGGCDSQHAACRHGGPDRRLRADGVDANWTPNYNAGAIPVSVWLQPLSRTSRQFRICSRLGRNNFHEVLTVSLALVVDRRRSCDSSRRRRLGQSIGPSGPPPPGSEPALPTYRFRKPLLSTDRPRHDCLARADHTERSWDARRPASTLTLSGVPQAPIGITPM